MKFNRKNKAVLIKLPKSLFVFTINVY